MATKEIVKSSTKDVLVPGQTGVDKLLSEAVAKGASVETMERLLAMRRELKAEFAKEQFDTAMADFQKECPVIKKQKAGGTTRSGEVGYRYAPLEQIVTQTKDLLHKHGFSYAIQTKTGKGEVTAICTARHEAGHSESSEMTVPLGGKTGIMSDTQVTAAAITFAKRYAFCNVFGILTGDDDSDAKGTEITNPRVGMEEAIKKLKAQKSIAALESTWRSLTATQRADDEVRQVAKECKRIFTK